MEPFRKHTGVVAPLDRANIDTDAIIPKQFLKRIERRGFGAHLFQEWRYQDVLGTAEEPNFVLNQALYRKATILLARENFGCGSSREHAPWSLTDFGFKVLIAPSFADIFYNNCFNNGLLPIILNPTIVDELFKFISKHPGIKLTVDLAAQDVIRPDGKAYHFSIDAFKKQRLLAGLDQIGRTLQVEKAIQEYEKRLHKEKPWMG